MTTLHTWHVPVCNCSVGATRSPMVPKIVFEKQVPGPNRATRRRMMATKRRGGEVVVDRRFRVVDSRKRR